MLCIITARKQSLGQGNIFTSVCREFCLRGGACSGGGLVRGGAWWRPPPTATAAGGTHPTGMHYCLWIFLPQFNKVFLKKKI